MKFMTVVSTTGSVPMEGGLGSIGTDPVKVHDTYYYRQLVRSGSLDRVEAAAIASPRHAGASVRGDAEAPATTNRVQPSSKARV